MRISSRRNFRPERLQIFIRERHRLDFFFATDLARTLEPTPRFIQLLQLTFVTGEIKGDHRLVRKFLRGGLKKVARQRQSSSRLAPQRVGTMQPATRLVRHRGDELLRIAKGFVPVLLRGTEGKSQVQYGGMRLVRAGNQRQFRARLAAIAQLQPARGGVAVVRVRDFNRFHAERIILSGANSNALWFDGRAADC